MSARQPEVFADQIRDVSATEESVLLLSLLLFQVDLFLEVRVMDNFLQRIERLEVRINSSKKRPRSLGIPD